MPRNRALDDLVDGLARAQHGAFTLAQIADACDRRVAAYRVRSGEWQRVAAGTFVDRAMVDEWSACAALCLHVPEAAVGGHAAGRWWRFAGLPTGEDRLLAPVSCGARHPLLVRSADLRPNHVRKEPRGCLRITDPARTLLDLAACIPATSLERAVEAALRAGQATEIALRRRANEVRRPGRRGPAELLAVLDARPKGGPADSDGEVLLLQMLRAAGLPRPVRQHRIGGFRFDLAWPELRVAVELDGSTHRTPAQLHRDNAKQNRAVLSGWTVLRFTWARIEHEPARVLAEVAAAVAAARVS